MAFLPHQAKQDQRSPTPFTEGLGLELLLGNENSAQSFSDRSFWKSLRVVDVRAFGSWISAPKCLFFQEFEHPDRSFGPGYPREWPPDVRRISGPKTSSFENVYVPWVPHTAHKLLTPGHRSGDPWPPGRETPAPTRAVTGKICLCLCAFSFKFLKSKLGAPLHPSQRVWVSSSFPL